MVLLSTENPSLRLAHRPWAELPHAPQRGRPRYTFLWANQSSRSCSETTHTSELWLREKDLNTVQRFIHIFPAQIPILVTCIKQIIPISLGKVYTVQFKARVSAQEPRGQKCPCSTQTFGNKLGLQRSYRFGMRKHSFNSFSKHLMGTEMCQAQRSHQGHRDTQSRRWSRNTKIILKHCSPCSDMAMHRALWDHARKGRGGTQGSLQVLKDKWTSNAQLEEN